MALLPRAASGSRWDGVAADYVDYASTGATGFIPEVWSSKIIM